MMPRLANTALPTAAAELHTHAKIYTSSPTHTRRNVTVMWVVTCPLDDFHHVGGEVAHTVISCAIVVNAALPAPVRMLFQNLPTVMYR